jgi:hypothetical protein
VFLGCGFPGLKAGAFTVVLLRSTLSTARVVRTVNVSPALRKPGAHLREGKRGCHSTRRAVLGIRSGQALPLRVRRHALGVGLMWRVDVAAESPASM